MTKAGSRLRTDCHGTDRDGYGRTHNDGAHAGGIAFGCILILYPFMSALLWAAILTFSTWPIYVRLRRHTNPLIAALGMTVMSAVVMVVPLTLVVSSGIVELPQTLPDAIDSITTVIHLPSLPVWLQHIPHLGPQMNETWEKWRVDVGNIDQMIRPYSGRLVQWALGGIMQLASGLAHLGMALFMAFFFWLGGEALGATFVSVVRRIAGGTRTVSWGSSGARSGAPCMASSGRLCCKVC